MILRRQGGDGVASWRRRESTKFANKVSDEVIGEAEMVFMEFSLLCCCWLFVLVQ